jgi:hypothetical protein
MSRHGLGCFSFAFKREGPVEVPFPKSWWVEPPRLLAGCYPGAQDPEEARWKLNALLDVGIRCVLCLQEPEETNYAEEPFVPYEPALRTLAADRGLDLRLMNFPIQDSGTPTLQVMTRILDTVEGALQNKLPVYIHCWGGHGRTGTVVGCWLVRQGLSGQAALDRIRRLREHDLYLDMMLAPESPAQRQLVLDWAGSERMARASR